MIEGKQRTNGVDIIIINRNTVQLTIECIASIRKSSIRVPCSIIVVDNASTDNSVERINELYPEVTIVPLNENYGYGAAFNKALLYASSTYCCVANSDLIFHDGMIDEVVDYMTHEKNVGCCGVQQYYADGGWQRSFGMLPGIMDGIIDMTGGSFVYRTLYPRLLKLIPILRKPHRVGYIDGAFMCFRRDNLDELHGFDERFTFFSEDVDICKRLTDRNYQVVFLPMSRLTHLRGATREAYSDRDFHYLHLNIATRYLYVSIHCSQLSATLWSAMQTWYYTTLTFIYSIVSLAMLNHDKRKRYKHRALLSWHLVSVNIGYLQQLVDNKPITLPKL